MKEFAEILLSLNNCLLDYRKRLVNFDKKCIDTNKEDYDQDVCYEVLDNLKHLNDLVNTIRDKFSNYPLYVCFEDGYTALKYVGDNTYYRHAGSWDIKVRMVDGIILVDEWDHLHDIKLIETTREHWLEDNKGYV